MQTADAEEQDHERVINPPVIGKNAETCALRKENEAAPDQHGDHNGAQWIESQSTS